MKGPLRVALTSCFKTSFGSQLFILKWIFLARSLSCKSNSYLCERLCTRTRFEIEAKSNSKMAHTRRLGRRVLSVSLSPVSTTHGNLHYIPCISSMMALSLSDSEKYFSSVFLAFFLAASHSFRNDSISFASVAFEDCCE